MARRMLSGLALKGIANSFSLRVASRSHIEQSLRTYSSITSGDSDTHEDFRPTNKLDGSGISMADVIQLDIKKNPVMIYMKGVPDAPRCGFSALAVKVLQQYGVPIGSRNILEDTVLKEGVKAFSNWPTFPQIFVKGEFIGGSDIVLNMHQNGQLRELLDDIKGDNTKRSEKT
ncbi:hypothetical protein HPP92_006344 [Vanilla planifolia]|uniref:Glutaredoxin domain-containing protein n=1 Tax=Vanilla planifolia TaxID=51239 RepID=A0A835RQG1_VANPL|nr:hypothetical protein HPP92_006344 [Vanilla planifolia]